MQKTQLLYCCRDMFTAPLHSNVRSGPHRNSGLLFLRACILRALPSNGCCLPSHCLATSLYATLYIYIYLSTDMLFMSAYLIAVTKSFMSAIKQANFDKQIMSCFKVHSQVVFVTRTLEIHVKIDDCHSVLQPIVLLFTVKLTLA
jgi:hypothetical protein